MFAGKTLVQPAVASSDWSVCPPGDECPSWMVPISICTSEDAKCCKLKVLLDRPETTITVSGVGPDQWVKVRAPPPRIWLHQISLLSKKRYS